MSYCKKLILPFIILLLHGGYSQAFAQGNNNPFELKHRLDKNQLAVADTIFENDTLNKKPQYNNPFEVSRLRKKSKQIAGKNVGIEPIMDLKSVRRKTPKSNFKFWVITFLLVLFTLMITLYNNYVVKTYRAFLNDNFLKMIQRETGTIAAVPYFILYTLYFISMGVFLFLILEYYNAQLPYSDFLNLLLLISVVLIIFLLKHMVIRILAFTLPVKKVFSQYNFTIIIFNIIIGIVLIPANIFIAFAPVKLTVYLIYGTILVILGLYLFRSLRSLFLAGNFLGFHKFHFFMYLCTVEIAPLLVLLKIVLLLTGLH